MIKSTEISVCCRDFIKMSLYKKIICFLIVFVVSAVQAESKENFGVGEEMLQPIMPEEYAYSLPPHQVWQAADHIVATRIKAQILVKDSSNLILSWFERFETAIEDQEKDVGSNKPDKKRQIFETQLSEVGEGGMAITTVCVRPRSRGSLMRIRRVYYGPRTQPEMVHSRGVFANYFHELVSQKLGIR